MNNYDDLIGLLARRENFAFARFNDGEMMGVEKSGSLVARGDQVVNDILHEKLIEVLKHDQHNYWKGKPCRVCYPEHRKVYESYVPKEYEFQTHAVIFCNNGHWKKFMADFAVHHQDRPMVWIGGEDQKIENLKGYNIVQSIKVPSKDAWSDYENVRGKVSEFQSDSIVVMSCGPMSRVLACEWFQERQDCTFLDLGSTFDPLTRKIFLKCHTGVLRYCKECNFNKVKK